jgi:hypothetical protein
MNLNEMNAINLQDDFNPHGQTAKELSRNIYLPRLI